MPCDKSALLDFLDVLNGNLTKKATLVAPGGTTRASPKSSRQRHPGHVVFHMAGTNDQFIERVRFPFSTGKNKVINPNPKRKQERIIHTVHI
jgi:hypothetical protein